MNERASRWPVAICGAAGWLAYFPGALFAQYHIDLSQAAVETVVGPRFEGGYFHRIGDIVVNEDGIWVLDSGQGEIRRFDHYGQPRTQYGRPGNGPGEFLSPTKLNVDTVLDVLDPRQGRIVRFTLAGDHIATRTTPKVANTLGIRVPPLLVRPMSDGTTVAVTSGWYAPEPRYSDPYERVLVVRPGTDQRPDTVFSYHFGGARWRAGRHFGGVNVPFGSAGAVTSSATRPLSLPMALPASSPSFGSQRMGWLSQTRSIFASGARPQPPKMLTTYGSPCASLAGRCPGASSSTCPSTGPSRARSLLCRTGPRGCVKPQVGDANSGQWRASIRRTCGGLCCRKASTCWQYMASMCTV